AVASPGDGMALRTCFGFPLSVSEALVGVPLGDGNRVALDSPWPHPSSVGTLAPGLLDVDANGFRAQWELPALAANTQATYARWLQRGGKNGSEAPAGIDSIGVQLVDPVDIYTKADRATRYGLLFVALTFVGFFMFELLRQLRIHPIQYALVGLALAIF